LNSFRMPENFIDKVYWSILIKFLAYKRSTWEQCSGKVTENKTEEFTDLENLNFTKQFLMQVIYKGTSCTKSPVFS
jgi:hypothetical protein